MCLCFVLPLLETLVQMSEKRFVFYLWPQDFWKCSLVKTGVVSDKKVLNCVRSWLFLRAFYPDFIWFYAETLGCFYVLFTNNNSMITKHSKIENSHKSWLFSRSKMFCYFSWPYWPAHIKQWINTYLELKPQTIKLLLIPRDIYLFSLNADCTTPPCVGEGGTRQWAVSASVKPAISQLIM